MEKYSILLGVLDKQLSLINKLYKEITAVDLHVYEKRYLFALKTQQFYTAIEDLLKQIAKAFENHIEDISSYPKELLIRLNTEIPKIRPAVLSKNTLTLLDKIRAFRHFIRHAYDCELDQEELSNVQDKLRKEYTYVEDDFHSFRNFIKELSG